MARSVQSTSRAAEEMPASIAEIAHSTTEALQGAGTADATGAFK